MRVTVTPWLDGREGDAKDFKYKAREKQQLVTLQTSQQQCEFKIISIVAKHNMLYVLVFCVIYSVLEFYIPFYSHSLVLLGHAYCKGMLQTTKLPLAFRVSFSNRAFLSLSQSC